MMRRPEPSRKQLWMHRSLVKGDDVGAEWKATSKFNDNVDGHQVRIDRSQVPIICVVESILTQARANPRT